MRCQKSAQSYLSDGDSPCRPYGARHSSGRSHARRKWHLLFWSGTCRRWAGMTTSWAWCSRWDGHSRYGIITLPCSYKTSSRSGLA